MEYTCESLIEAMSARGLRITTQRKLIAEAFINNKGLVLPRYIHHFLSKHIPGVSQDTVYRNLKLLVEIGLLEEHHLMTGVRFKLITREDGMYYRFICVECQRIFQHEFTPEARRFRPPEAIHIVSHKLEFYGVCKECIVQE
ncbi:Fur family transcriptional regulator [Paenibacillus peoriae]|uniref:Fur family transcriptional regulator n=1 Tax=Paenibacillus peoriae TaxID=59893 RepID=UPI003F9833E9